MGHLYLFVQPYGHELVNFASSLISCCAQKYSGGHAAFLPADKDNFGVISYDKQSLYVTTWL